MFFSIELLTGQKNGKFAIAWLTATRGAQCFSKQQIEHCNICELCEEIEKFLISQSNRPKARLALPLSSKLINGTIKIQFKKAVYLIDDLVAFLSRVNTPLFLKKSPPLTDSDQFEQPRIPNVRIRNKRLKQANVLSEESTPPASAPVDTAVQVDQQLQWDGNEELPLRDNNTALSWIQRTRNGEQQGASQLPHFTQNVVEPLQQVSATQRLSTIRDIPDVTIVPVGAPKPAESVHPSELEIIPIAPIPEEINVTQEVQGVPIAKEQPPAAEELAKEEPLPQEAEIAEQRRRRRVSLQDDVFKSSDRYVHLTTKAKKTIDKVRLHLRPTSNVYIDRCGSVCEEYIDLNACKKQHAFEILKERQTDTSKMTFNPILFFYVGNDAREMPEIMLTEGEIRGSLHSVNSASRSLSRISMPHPTIRSITPQSVRQQLFETPKPLSQAEIIPVPPPEDYTLSPPAKKSRRVAADDITVPALQATVVETVAAAAQAPAAPRNKLPIDVDERDDATTKGPSSSLIKQRTIVSKVRKWNFELLGPLTLEDVCEIPINRRNIAITFNYLLMLHKKKYVILKNKPNSIELGTIHKGAQLLQNE